MLPYGDYDARIYFGTAACAHIGGTDLIFLGYYSDWLKVKPQSAPPGRGAGPQPRRPADVTPTMPPTGAPATPVPSPEPTPPVAANLEAAHVLAADSDSLRRGLGSGAASVIVVLAAFQLVRWRRSRVRAKSD